MMSPVTAIITFLPTEESHNNQRRFIRASCSHVHYGLGRSNRLGRLPQFLSLLVGECHLDNSFEPATANLAGHAAEDVPQPELTLKPGRTRENPLPVQRNRLDHLH